MQFDLVFKGGNNPTGINQYSRGGGGKGTDSHHSSTTQSSINHAKRTVADEALPLKTRQRADDFLVTMEHHTGGKASDDLAKGYMADIAKLPGKSKKEEYSIHYAGALRMGTPQG